MQLKSYYKDNRSVIFLVLWMIIIFVFSSQDGTESTEKSKLVIYSFNYIGLDLNSMLGDMADFIVRKGAHMTEYFILAMLFNKVLKNKYSVKKSLVMACGLSFLYACSDEYHQTFIPGRAGQFKDVMIDTFGAFIYIIINFIIGIKKKWLKVKE